MANNPVQVVLNTRDYFVVPEPGRMGHPKDFFQSRDSEFARHRSNLSRQVSAVGAALQQSGVDTAFVRVRLSKEAWAKSHRPTYALFPPTEFPCVGASRLGDLFFQVTPRGLETIEEQITSAEDETRWRERPSDGKRVSVPSHQRSEVGAIEEIALPTAPDKRNFDPLTAVRWLSDPRTSGAYLVELFDLARATRDEPQPSVMLRRYAARFIDRLRHTRLGVEIYPFRAFRPEVDDSYARVLAVRLVNTGAGVNYLDYSGRVLAGRRSVDIAPFDSDVGHHERLLEFLDGDPVVRRISLPPLLLPSTSATTPIGKKVAIPTRQENSAYPRIGVIDGGISDVLAKWVVGRSDLLDPKHKATETRYFHSGATRRW